MTPIDPASRVQRGLCGNVHQPDAAAAVDQRHAACRQRAADLASRRRHRPAACRYSTAEQADAGDGCAHLSIIDGTTRRQVRGDGIALRLRHRQAALGAPPQHIVRGARPFLGHQVIDFARGEARAEVLPQVGHRLRIAQNVQRARAVSAGQSAQQVGGQLRKSATQQSKEGVAVAVGQVAARQRLVARPLGFHAGEVRRQLRERGFGQLAIGGDLAAEDRQHRSAVGSGPAFQRVDLEHVVARHRGRVAGTVVVQRPHAAERPHDVRPAVSGVAR